MVAGTLGIGHLAATQGAGFKDTFEAEGRFNVGLPGDDFPGLGGVLILRVHVHAPFIEVASASL